MDPSWTIIDNYDVMRVTLHIVYGNGIFVILYAYEKVFYSSGVIPQILRI